MKVFVNALEGYVPADIIKTFNTFLDFCYLARQNVLTEDSLDALDTALERFHHYREIFRVSSMRPDGFSLPRQHSLKHYRRNIENFGAPNGLCSSITESKHITAVKKPWRRLNRYEALKQMLTINTRNDKLAAAHADFSSRGMLRGTCLGDALQKLRQAVDAESVSDLDDEDEFSGPDGNGEAGSDLDLDHVDNEDDGSPGPVDGPSIFSEVILAHKKGLANFFYHRVRTFTDPSTQPRGTLVPHSRCSENTSASQTSTNLFGASSFMNKTQRSPDHLPFTSVQQPNISRRSLSSTRQPQPSAHRAIPLVLAACTAKPFGAPHDGKPVMSSLTGGTALS